MPEMCLFILCAFRYVRVFKSKNRENRLKKQIEPCFYLYDLVVQLVCKQIWIIFERIFLTFFIIFFFFIFAHASVRICVCVCVCVCVSISQIHFSYIKCCYYAICIYFVYSVLFFPQYLSSINK